MGKVSKSRPFVIPSIIASITTLGWSVIQGGYVSYTSKKRRDPPFKRGALMHSCVIEILLGRKLDPAFDVHHMDFNKKHNCPDNLLYCPKEFNRTVGNHRDPYTGVYITREEWFRRYPASDEPDWVVNVNNIDEGDRDHHE